MAIRPEEISALIKEQILHYEESMESNDIGTVITVGDGIALIQGLDKAMASELLLFPNDVYGMVLNLEEDHVGAVILGNDVTIKEGDEVKRTKHKVHRYY
jgi:F-type H+-transporting ATPase subunit alpha